MSSNGLIPWNFNSSCRDAILRVFFLYVETRYLASFLFVCRDAIPRVFFLYVETRYLASILFVCRDAIPRVYCHLLRREVSRLYIFNSLTANQAIKPGPMANASSSISKFGV